MLPLRLLLPFFLALKPSEPIRWTRFMLESYQHGRDTPLIKNRNKTVAKSFYRELKAQGFSHQQIIELSATLLDLVTDDMQPKERDADDA